MQQKIELLGLPLDKLKVAFEKIGLTSLDAKRVFPWIHVKCADSFEVMSDVPLKVREILKEACSLARPKCIALQKSSDGTQKALLELSDGNRVETVFIPEETRNTVCVSSQVGCAMGCKFCHTGTQSFTRNLTSSEIMAQIFFWKDKFSITNLVFMGMGEPLLNFDNLSDALNLLLSEKAHNFSRNKITVSTCGIIDNAIENLASFGVKLAISLHAPNDVIRNSIMPINRKYNISVVLKAAKNYQIQSNTTHVTFEYLLLKNVNDSDENARELAALLRGIPSKVNLITFNSWPNSELQGSSKEVAHRFLRILLSKNIRAIIRKSRGDDILAACGQLKSKIL
ncbi:MAG: 23S rRNA (adenine(2503)-C(2))-methyltransferase RlmN [Alphaproteobacteria bacterium]|nr:23S rRNA (adenine(2503)-C(2))-methyltransferase RlmN [Alphaproteobacteria bacterium]